MRSTFQNAATMTSIALFFTMLIAGRSEHLPAVMRSGLVSNGVPARTAAPIASLPPIAVLFAAFPGYNPMKTLILPAFMDGMHLALWISTGLALLAAAASYLRGGRYIAGEQPAAGDSRNENAEEREKSLV